jgi:hypothetical protein
MSRLPKDGEVAATENKKSKETGSISEEES